MVDGGEPPVEVVRTRDSPRSRRWPESIPTMVSGWKVERQPRRDRVATRRAAISPRHRVTSTRWPAKPRSAGSRVRDATAVTATTVAAAAASPVMNARPMRTMPSSEMTTVVPANATARPAVSMRDDRRVLDGCPLVQVLPVSGHDEQRVVDTDTEAEHDGDRGREVGDREEVCEQPGKDRSHSDAGEGDADGEAHGEHRPEGEDEHDHGEGQAEQLRARHLELGEAALRRARPGHLGSPASAPSAPHRWPSPPRAWCREEARSGHRR